MGPTILMRQLGASRLALQQLSETFACPDSRVIVHNIVDPSGSDTVAKQLCGIRNDGLAEEWMAE